MLLSSCFRIIVLVKHKQEVLKTCVAKFTQRNIAKAKVQRKIIQDMKV